MLNQNAFFLQHDEGVVEILNYCTVLTCSTTCNRLDGVKYCLHDTTASIVSQHYRFFVTKILEIWLNSALFTKRFNILLSDSYLLKTRVKKMQHQ